MKLTKAKLLTLVQEAYKAVNKGPVKGTFFTDDYTRVCPLTAIANKEREQERWVWCAASIKQEVARILEADIKWCDGFYQGFDHPDCDFLSDTDGFDFGKYVRKNLGVEVKNEFY